MPVSCRTMKVRETSKTANRKRLAERIARQDAEIEELKVARSYLAKLIAKVTRWLGPAYEELLARLPGEAFLNIDETGRRWCERIWTAIATCAQQGRSVFEFLLESVPAHLLRCSPDFALAVRHLTVFFLRPFAGFFQYSGIAVYHPVNAYRFPQSLCCPRGEQYKAMTITVSSTISPFSPEKSKYLQRGGYPGAMRTRHAGRSGRRWLRAAHVGPVPSTFAGPGARGAIRSPRGVRGAGSGCPNARLQAKG